MSQANVGQSVNGGSTVGGVDDAAGVLESLIRASEEATAKFGEILQRGERVRTEVAETAAQLEDRMKLGIRLLKALEQERTRTEAAAAGDGHQDLPAEWRQKIDDLGARVTATEQRLSSASSDPDQHGTLEQQCADLEARLAAAEERLGEDAAGEATQALARRLDDLELDRDPQVALPLLLDPLRAAAIPPRTVARWSEPGTRPGGRRRWSRTCSWPACRPSP